MGGLVIIMKQKMEQHLITIEDEARLFGFRTRRDGNKLIIYCED